MLHEGNFLLFGQCHRLPSPAAPVTPFPMDLLNRAVLIVTPAQPFLDWLRYVDPNCQVTLDELRESGTAYLIPPFECLEDAAERLLNYYQKIFRQELWQWHSIEEDWPKEMTWEMFKEWFDVEFHPQVVDAGEEAGGGDLEVL